MKNYFIRPATSEDSSHIRKLVIKGHINPTGLDWRRFIVAINFDDQLIGCGQIKPHRDGSREMASLVVTEAYRGQGLARDILESLLEDEPGPIYLMCRSGLGGLYEKFGFRALDYDKMPRYFQRVSKVTGILEPLRKQGESLLVMVWKTEGKDL